MKNSKFLTALAILLIGVGVAYFILFSPKNKSRTFEIPRVDPSTFTREQALEKLKFIEANSQLSIETQFKRIPTDSSDIPNEVAPFLIPKEGEEVQVEKEEKGLNYYIHYISRFPLTESHFYLVRHTGSSTPFALRGGLRQELAATFDAESKDYQMRVSQIAKDGESSEVFIYLQKRI